MGKLLVFLWVGLALPCFASAVQDEQFMPANNLHLDDLKFGSDMTETQFRAIIDGVIAIYSPEAVKLGAQLSVTYGWNDSTVNASAQQIGAKWVINMYGGLARRPEVTPDGFALVVCHELGHHFGGFPYYAGESWAASEGQADYFATQVCARRLWGQAALENEAAASVVDDVAKTGCDRAWTAVAQRNLCYRTSMAGLSLARLLGALNGNAVPQFNTPDPRRVTATNTAHPAAQCRLDTYYQGGLCVANARPDFITGRKLPGGLHGKGAEHEAAANSCFGSDGYAQGVRPRCWFYPALAGSVPASDDGIALTKNTAW